MAIVDIRWESEEERAVVEALMLDWHLYGQMHLTNAKGLTRLDPQGVTYAPTGAEQQAATSPIKGDRGDRHG